MRNALRPRCVTVGDSPKCATLLRISMVAGVVGVVLVGILGAALVLVGDSPEIRHSPDMRALPM